MAKIKKLLFKLLQFNYSEDNLYLAFSLEQNDIITLDDVGRPQNVKDYTLRALDVNASIHHDRPIVHDLKIEDEDKFLSNTVIVPFDEDVADLLDVMLEVNSIALLKIYQEAKDYRAIINSLNFIMNDEKVSGSEGSITLNSDKDELANIVFKTVNGDTSSLQQNHVEALYSVIQDIIAKHSLTFNGTPEERKSIKDEVEYRIIETLPNDIKAHQLDINVDAIMQEIEENHKQDTDLDMEEM